MFWISHERGTTSQAESYIGRHVRIPLIGMILLVEPDRWYRSVINMVLDGHIRCPGTMFHCSRLSILLSISDSMPEILFDLANFGSNSKINPPCTDVIDASLVIVALKTKTSK